MTQIVQNNNRWILSGDIVINTASAILKTSQTFTIADNATVDFADVEDIDTTAVSLIFEWKRRAAREKQTLAFVNLPDNLTSLVQLYNVAELIN